MCRAESVHLRPAYLNEERDMRENDNAKFTVSEASVSSSQKSFAAIR